MFSLPSTRPLLLDSPCEISTQSGSCWTPRTSWLMITLTCVSGMLQRRRSKSERWGHELSSIKYLVRIGHPFEWQVAPWAGYLVREPRARARGCGMRHEYAREATHGKLTKRPLTHKSIRRTWIMCKPNFHTCIFCHNFVRRFCYSWDCAVKVEGRPENDTLTMKRAVLVLAR